MKLVWPIEKAYKTKSTTELKANLEHLVYYGHFQSNLSTILCPLYRLLRQNASYLSKGFWFIMTPNKHPVLAELILLVEHLLDAAPVMAHEITA